MPKIKLLISFEGHARRFRLTGIGTCLSSNGPLPLRQILEMLSPLFIITTFTTEHTGRNRKLDRNINGWHKMEKRMAPLPTVTLIGSTKVSRNYDCPKYFPLIELWKHLILLNFQRKCLAAQRHFGFPRMRSVWPLSGLMILKWGISSIQCMERQGACPQFIPLGLTCTTQNLEPTIRKFNWKWWISVGRLPKISHMLLTTHCKDSLRQRGEFKEAQSVNLACGYSRKLYYIAKVTWLTETTLLAIHLNRPQNIASYYICDSETAICTFQFEKTSTGWIDVHAPVVSATGGDIVTILPRAVSEGVTYKQIVHINLGTRVEKEVTKETFSVNSILGWDQATNKMYACNWLIIVILMQNFY